MKLVNLTDQIQNGWRRISMDLIWEQTDRPTQTLYFEAEGKVAELMTATPNAFAIACIPLAFWLDEQRLWVEGQLCTRLQSGSRIINQIFSEWHSKHSAITLEASEGFQPTRPAAKRATATLLSGGVDGLTTVRVNRQNYSLDHPESIRACITLFGINTFDIDADGQQVPERLQAFDAVLKRLREIGDAEQFTVHPVRTNIRSLAPSYKYWTAIGFGAGHSAACQLFTGVYDKVLWASDGAGPNPTPVASHPLLNPHYSTDAVRIQGEQDEMDRVEKIKLLSDWEFGRRYMQPCHYVHIPKNNAINCGRCEKCVRTMLTLIGMGKLQKTEAFVENDLKARRVFFIPVNNQEKASLLGQAIPLLKQLGRNDLVWAIRARLLIFSLLRR